MALAAKMTVNGRFS